MGIHQFAAKMKEMILMELKDGYEVSIREINKNNGLNLLSMIIASEESNVSPTIYLESFYDMYLEGEPLQKLVDMILLFYHQCMPKEKVDMSFFENFESARERICYKLIKREGNEELLAEIPYIDFLDLAVCFYCTCYHYQIGEGSILIRNDHMKAWNVTTKQLMDYAIKNTQKLLPDQMITMMDMIHELKKEYEIEEDMNQMRDAHFMRILTNPKRTYGAACILYPGVLAKIAETMGDGFYVIPSSVHEVIIVHKQAVGDLKMMKNTIYEVNRTQVREEEVLSDNLYYYDHKDNRLFIV